MNDPSRVDFTTNRLIAERLSDAHLGDLTELHLDPEAARYLGGVRSPAKTKEYVKANLAHWDRHGFGLWVFRTVDGKFAGRGGIRHIAVEGEPEVEIAYTLRQELWGRGLGTEIAQSLVARWRGGKLSPSLIGIASLDNMPSRRILANVGFIFERDAIYHGEAIALYRAWL